MKVRVINFIFVYIRQYSVFIQYKHLWFFYIDVELLQFVLPRERFREALKHFPTRDDREDLES